MSALERLNKELSYPGQQALYLAARKKGLDVTRDEVRRLVSSNTAKQEISAAQPSKGNIAAETESSRWQADLAEFHPRDSGLKKLQYALVVVNVFDRKTYTRVLPDKKPMTVRNAMKSIVQAAPGTPIHDLPRPRGGVHVPGHEGLPGQCRHQAAPEGKR